MPVNETYNYIEINPRLATAGQPTENQIQALQKEGYKVVINLDAIDSIYALEGEADVLESLGLSYIQVR